jgi:hypothetical protein
MTTNTATAVIEYTQAASELSVEQLVDPVVTRFYPNLLTSIHACLAVFGSMALTGRSMPLSLILETPSGYGKTAILQMGFPLKGRELEVQGSGFRYATASAWRGCRWG